MIIILSVFKMLAVITIVATIHEFGHFLMAKLFKMPVKEFSIGFGPKLISKEIKGTIYSIRILPLGGFVNIVGEDNQKERETVKDSFSNKPKWQKFLVLVMGAVFNFILALIIFFSIGLLSNSIYTNKVESIQKDTIAFQNDIRPGDVIKKIDNKKINSYLDIDENKIKEDKMVLLIERNGEQIEKVINNPKQKWGYLGVTFKLSGDKISNEVEFVIPGQPAQYVDIKAGDKIVKINGKETNFNEEIIDDISANPNKEITVTIERNGEYTDKKVTTSTRTVFLLGVIPYEKKDLNVFERIENSYRLSILSIKDILNSYISLLSGKVNIDELSGIIGVGEVVSKSSGFVEFLSMLAFISFSIGVANLFPILPLDGGKVLVLLIESVIRKTVPVKVETIVSLIGLGLLILLSIYIGYNDIVRIF